jgi:hypothetical protein
VHIHPSLQASSAARALRISLRVLVAFAAAYPLGAMGAPVVIHVAVGGTTAVHGAAPGEAVPAAGLELDVQLDENAVGLAAPGAGKNRSIAKGLSPGVDVAATPLAQANPTLLRSFHGLDHFAQRTANGGNQFSTEPPDQGLCAGGGFVLETVNSALRVFDATGAPLTGVVDLNSFYGYPAAFDRAAVRFGPDVFDPSCYFDPQSQRWFHLASTLERVSPTTTALSGASHIDLAVSLTPDPRGGFVVYRIPAEDDGTNGTPDHHCTLDGVNPGPCFPDYPHIGADRNGIYITTNEFDFFGPGFHGAEIYAISKSALVAGGAIDVVLLDTADPSFGIPFDGIVGFPGFTVWPAESPDGLGEADTQFFLSSQAVFNASGVDDRLRLWSVTGTSTLGAATPNLGLSAQTVNVNQYGVPPPSEQQAGSTPLADCLNDNTFPIAPGVKGCWQFATSTRPTRHEVEGPIDSNDSRMQQVFLAGGKLFGALDTAVAVKRAQHAGIAWFVIDPHAATVANQGVLALDGVDLDYPALAVSASGRGVVAFTAVGPGTFPSAGYAALDATNGAGDVHIAAAGKGPQDGFSEYHAFPPFRPRWGDYGAAAVDGDTIWIGSEYIGQTCTFAQFLTSGFTCGNTRTILANWGTRVSAVQP